MKQCAIDWCEKPVKSRGLCSRHYERWRTGQDVEGDVSRRSRGEGGLGVNGYIYIGVEGRSELLHRVIAAVALGRELKGTECVHHFDGNPANNAKDNLVICPDKSYHALLHRRMDALIATGHADWRKCQLCGKYSSLDDPDLWYNDKAAQHRSCNREHVRRYRERLK